MKNIRLNRLIVLTLVLVLAACREQFEVYPVNPNVANENSQVPPAFLLRRVLFEVHRGAGNADGQPGNVVEEPLNLLSRLNQYTTGLTFPLYGGSNAYNWTVTATPYNQIKNLNRMDELAINAFGEERNPYLALSKFLRAYSFIWLTQRVGDIPVREAGLGMENLTPAFDTQPEVFAISLQLLEEANAELTEILSDPTAISIDGDIYYGNDLRKWQKAVNSYTLRVLISLSKRADDTPELAIKQRFAAIVNDPVKYPVFTGPEDNLDFVYVPAFNRYPTQNLSLYANQTTISATYLKITTATKDPRTFIAATPAPAELAAGKTIGDFSAYVGTENGTPQNVLNSGAQQGRYSYINYIYWIDNTIDNAPQPFTILGYSEMCFNIAEAINRGWLDGDAEAYYRRGINASLDAYGLADGTVLTIGNVVGVPYGTVTVLVSDFLNDPGVVYKGNNPEGLEQILRQKYVAMFQNSGWEPFYNQRRTGIPQFSVGDGTNAERRLPLRWLYPVNEVENNAANVREALQRQFNGTDDVFAEMWMLR